MYPRKGDLTEAYTNGHIWSPLPTSPRDPAISMYHEDVRKSGHKLIQIQIYHSICDEIVPTPQTWVKSYVASCDPSATTDGNTRWSIKPAFLLETTTAAWDGFSASSHGQRQLLPMLPSIKICSDFRRIHLGFQPGRLKLNPFPFPSPADGLNKGYLLDPFGRFTRKWNNHEVWIVWLGKMVPSNFLASSQGRIVNLDKQSAAEDFHHLFTFPWNNMYNDV